MSQTDDLSALRKRIDELDVQIQQAISERASIAEGVARAKANSDDTVDYYRPEREADILKRVVERNQGPLGDKQIATIFREIISACLALQKPLHIAYLGPEGTFTQAAALKHFGQSVETLPLGGIDQVFREVESGAAHYGVVPVENSTEGVINHTLDMFVNSPLNICGEVGLRIHHCLMSREQDMSAIKRIYSHQQSLGQCRQWLDNNLPAIEQVGVSSNAEGAIRAAGEAGSAAIGSSIAAENYGLNTLARNIEDEPDNTTRFLIIGRREVPETGNDKTSLLVSTRNESGALHRLLEPIASNGLSMTRIESRPSRQANWDYVFFVDIEGHRDNERVARAIGEIERDASMLRVLGSYPKAVID